MKIVPSTIGSLATMCTTLPALAQSAQPPGQSIMSGVVPMSGYVSTDRFSVGPEGAVFVSET